MNVGKTIIEDAHFEIVYYGEEDYKMRLSHKDKRVVNIIAKWSMMLKQKNIVLLRIPMFMNKKEVVRTLKHLKNKDVELGFETEMWLEANK